MSLVEDKEYFRELGGDRLKGMHCYCKPCPLNAPWFTFHTSVLEDAGCCMVGRNITQAHHWGSQLARQISCFLRHEDAKDMRALTQLQQWQLATTHLTVVLVRHMFLVVSLSSSCAALASFHAVVASGMARSLLGLFDCFFACLMKTTFVTGSDMGFWALGPMTALHLVSTLLCPVGSISHSHPVTLFSSLVPNIVVTLHHLSIQFSQTKLVIAM